MPCYLKLNGTFLILQEPKEMFSQQTFVLYGYVFELLVKTKNILHMRMCIVNV